MKRFWEQARIEEGPDGFSVRLDQRPVKTPAGRPVAVPVRAMADAIAAEWEAQTEYVNPLSMPMTRIAATCLDRVAPEMQAVADNIAAYSETDLLCYRADAPEELVVRQAHGWDPLLDWAAGTFGAQLLVQTGVMHRAQPDAAVLALGAEVRALDSWRLTGLADLVTISGSLVLGLAVLNGRLDATAAWTLCRIDEQWNIDQWGEDHEAAELAAKRENDFQQAAKVLGWLDNG